MTHLRRAFCLLTCLCLLAGSAQAAPYTANGLFSITYDDSIYTLDNAGYHHESDLPYRWLFTLYSREHIIDVSVDYEERLADVTLVGAQVDMHAKHMAAMLASSTEEDVCTHVETVNVAQDGLMFNIFRVDSKESGSYLFAETVVDGWMVTFFAYYDKDGRSVDDALTDALRSVVATFEPAW